MVEWFWQQICERCPLFPTSNARHICRDWEERFKTEKEGLMTRILEPDREVNGVALATDK